MANFSFNLCAAGHAPRASSQAHISDTFLSVPHACMCASRHRFPSTAADFPKLVEFKNRIAARPRMAEYLASEQYTKLAAFDSREEPQ